MRDHCPNRLNETLLSGYLDGELTQQEEQHVRIHLEDCAPCRTVFEDLSNLREVAMNTPIKEPEDSQWNEAPKNVASSVSRGLGWLLVVLWAVLMTGFALWQFWQEADDLWARLLVFGGLSAFGLLFISVLLDRIRSSQSDRYREVKK